ncbi:MAG TPA: diguanylate cyclase [Solirubrobacterales bacterium]|nr:diguanylate cyclase [Solirubrobacterales bacterium]
MRFRFWLGFAAVAVLAIGSVSTALVIRSNEEAGFHQTQRDEATRAARQAEAVANFSVGQLANAAAFYQAEHHFNRNQFELIARPLLGHGALTGTGFVLRVRGSERRRFERQHGFPIVEKAGVTGGLRRAGDHRLYFPLVDAASVPNVTPPLGYNLGGDPQRAPFLRQALASGRPVATRVTNLPLGVIGLDVYRPVYRQGLATRTVAQRRRALLGFAVGAFRARRLEAAAISAVPRADTVQLRIGGRTVIGTRGRLEDPANAPIHVVNRVWLLVVLDPDRPDVGLPILVAAVGISLAALLGALILVWSRNERMQELRREAGQDALTGLKNRRRFEEDLRAEMARSRRMARTGALLMLDLDNFKRVNDSLGHPAGDRLIKEIATVLQRRARETDVLARLGGDEFAIVLPNCDTEEARVVAEAIATTIRERGKAEEEGPAVTASIGIALFGADVGSSFESVLSEADTAMYAAKDAGRDGVMVFDPVAVRGES